MSATPQGPGSGTRNSGFANPEPRTPKPVTMRELKAIHAQWRKIDAGRADDRDSRTARIEFMERVVLRPIASAKDLSSDEALRVISAMREETGEEFRAVGRRSHVAGRKGSSQSTTYHLLPTIGAMAVELWGERWQDLLNARVQERFKLPSAAASSLLPSQGRQLVEELLQRLAVAEIRRLRAQFGGPEKISREEIEGHKAQQRHKFFG